MDMGVAFNGRNAAEILRTQELDCYRVVPGDLDPRLHLLAQLAVKATGADIGGISLVYRTHVLVVGAGAEQQQLEKAISLCAHATEFQVAFFEVPDVLAEPELTAKQFRGMRHYAAATLFSRRGYVLGTLWVMTRPPRQLDESQRLLLQGLSRLVVEALDMRYCDAVTGMHNRTALVRQVQDMIAPPTASAIVVGYIDLSGFRQVNEIHGRDVGDRLLAEFAQRFKHWIHARGAAGHFGSDRFGFALPAAVVDEQVAALRQVVDAPFDLPGGRVHALSARIGIVREPLPTLLCAGALFDMAETASSMIGPMHGFSVVREYGSVLRDRARLLQALLDVLDDVPDGGELAVYFQPQVNVADGSLIGFEALARWTHPVFGAVPTQNFVALAESSGHSFKLDMVVARLVCRMVRQWQDALLPAIPVSLNLSRATLTNPGLPEAIASLLAEYGLSGALLEVEVTEGQLLEAPQTLHKCVDTLRALGLRIAIDDFGIGYSNLDAIATLHFDRLKVDRRFVHGVADSATTASLFQLIQGVARVSGAELLCEGLERQIDLDWLRRNHAYCVQGWYFSTAQPPQRAERLLRSWQTQVRSSTTPFDLHALFAREAMDA